MRMALKSGLEPSWESVHDPASRWAATPLLKSLWDRFHHWEYTNERCKPEGRAEGG